MLESHIQGLFAERIGGRQYGKSTALYKFEKIKRAKRAAMAAHPGAEILDLGVGEPDEMAFPEVVERWVPYQKIRDEKKSVGWTTWLDSHGTNADATRMLKDLFGFKPFETPKPVSLYVWLIGLHANENAVAIDCFAGCGTTAQAVIESNREDANGSNRKYILLEMARYFETVLIPRIQKVIYSKDWRDGKPVSREGSTCSNTSASNPTRTP